jgi:hypothetical protein
MNRCLPPQLCSANNEKATISCEHGGFSLILVRLAGIEPTTPWFVAKYSIQLSYSREKQDYSRAFPI